MRIAVLGAGSWGTALAAMLAEGGHDTTLWARDPGAAAELQARRENLRYLPGLRLPALVTATEDLAVAVRARELVVVALPSTAVREVVRAAAATIDAAALLVCASKGLEADTRLTLDRVLAEVAPGRPVVLLSGPTFAREIAAGLPAAAVAASTDPAAATAVQQVLGTPRFRVYTSPDVVGVALSGALKNVIAIAAGCCDGLGFGSNARAALVTRGLREVGRLVARLGGDPLTVAGLAGLGDLVLTCTGELSRNRQVGLALGRGEPLETVTGRLGQVAEGVSTARVADALARSLGVPMPITAQVAAVVSGHRAPRDAVAELLARGQGPESA